MAMKTLILTVLFAIPIFAQDLGNKFVEGIVYSGNEIFLMVDGGYLKTNQTDYYEEYYRKIYNDSTITNPNTVLSNDIDLNIIPFINLSHKAKMHRFQNPLSLGVILYAQDKNSYSLTPFAHKLIDSIKAK